MAQDYKISQLPTSSALDGSELFPIVQSGETRKANISQLSLIIGGATYWNSTKTYHALDSVLRAGKLWLANGINTNEDPGSGSHWDLQIINTSAYGIGWAASTLAPTQAATYAAVSPLLNMIDPATFVIKDMAGATSISADARTLNDLGDTRVNWHSSYLGYNFTISFDWASRQGRNSAGVIVFDYYGANAAFEVISTTQGFLGPRMTTTQKLAISSPSEGLEVYDLTLHKKSYYNGTVWINY